MSDVWAELNERQRAYLRALYDCDQDTEAGRRQRAARGHWDRTPASVWRWQMYGPVGPPSQLYTALRSAGLVDPGTGATWQALEDRGLVRCRYVPDVFGIQLLEVQITPRGRKVVRSATGEQRVRPPPKGQLRERQWAALARLYAAGDAGEESWDMMYGRGGFDWFRTLLRLRDYSGGALMEEYRALDGPSDESECKLDAFQKGFVFWEHPKPEYLPPIDDAGRREWLEGFLQAHADYPDGDDFEGGETAQEALDRMLEGHPALPALKAMLEATRTQLSNEGVGNAQSFS